MCACVCMYVWGGGDGHLIGGQNIVLQQRCRKGMQQGLLPPALAQHRQRRGYEKHTTTAVIAITTAITITTATAATGGDEGVIGRVVILVKMVH